VSSDTATNRAWRERVRGTEPPEHGASGYSNYNCSCDICRAGHAERARNYNKKRLEREAEQ